MQWVKDARQSVDPGREFAYHFVGDCPDRAGSRTLRSFCCAGEQYPAPEAGLPVLKEGMEQSLDVAMRRDVS